MRGLFPSRTGTPVSTSAVPREKTPPVFSTGRRGGGVCGLQASMGWKKEGGGGVCGLQPQWKDRKRVARQHALGLIRSIQNHSASKTRPQQSCCLLCGGCQKRESWPCCSSEWVVVRLKYGGPVVHNTTKSPQHNRNKPQHNDISTTQRKSPQHNGNKPQNKITQHNGNKPQSKQN